jgi:hypothetical protein
MKNIAVYAMGIVPDLIHWLFDIYHCLACYFMVEHGLLREDKDIRKGRINAVFPSLFNLAESSTTNKLTKIIRANINAKPEIQKRYSARSERYGAVTELALHRELSVFEGCARTGHSTGTTIDSYIDDNNPGYGLKAGMARCGYKNLDCNLKELIHVPRLEALGQEVAGCVEDLLGQVFIVNVPFFDKDGPLRPVLRVCLATLILYHPQVAKDCGGGNIICTSLNSAARDAKIFDVRFGKIAPEALLGHWSKLLAGDLERGRLAVPTTVKPELVSMAAAQNQALVMLGEVMKTLHNLQEHNSALEMKIASQSAEIAFLREEQQKNAFKLHHMKSPEDYTASKKRAKLDVPQQHEEAHMEPLDLFAAKCTEAVMKPVMAATRNLNEAISSVPSTGNKPAASGGTGKTMFVDLLVQHKDVLMDKVHDTPINRNSVSVASALRYCFELLDYVIKHDDQAKTDYITFRKKETVKEECLKLGKGLVQKCMDQMLLFEGTTPEVENQLKGKKKHTSTYRAIGARVGDHKLASIALEKMKDPNYKVSKEAQELKTKREVGGSSTPSDNRSMTAFLVRKNPFSRSSK